MSRMTLDEIGDRVRAFLGETSLAERVRKVEVDEASDFDDDALLRVLVTFRRPKQVDMRAVGDAVDEVRRRFSCSDDRFLIFQFSEAA